ncbi:MAG: TetR/AcrR family transcriptional regulator [Polyangiaceae bacterium]
MSKGEETRNQVLSAALSLASEIGLEGVTIGKLAQRVGLSKSGLFAHFSSKENLQVQLLEEAASRFIESVVARALRQPRGEPRVRALFDYWLEWGRADFLPGGCIFITAAVELDDRPGPARDRLVAMQRDLLDTLAVAVSIAMREGHFRRDLDARQMAHEIYTLVYGHAVMARLLRSAEIEPRTRAAFERLVLDARAPHSLVNLIRAQRKHGTSTAQ